MLRKLLMFLIPLVALGCAGQGTFSGVTPYVGSFSGTWTCPANGHTGTMSLSISPHATLVGTYVDTTANVSGQVSGNVEQSGGFRATVAMTTGNQSMTGQFSISGTSQSGVLAGNATVGTGASSQAITFSLPTDTASGPSAYAGSFQGNWTSPLNGHFGTLSFTISAQSKIVGSFADDVNGTSSAISGSVDQSGAFVATVTGSSGSQTLNGQLSIANAVISGNATLASGTSSQQLSFTLSSSQATSTYAGSYSGSWSSPANNHTGTISLTVAPNALITGSFVDTTANTTGTLSGEVSPTGAFNATIALSAGGSEGFSGQLSSASQGLDGNGNLATSGISIPLSFTLTTGSASTYAGSFSGSWNSPTNNHAGSISWTIANDAQIIGTFIDTTSATAGSISGTVNQNGTFNATVTYSSTNSQSLIGQLSLGNPGLSTSILTGNATLGSVATTVISINMPTATTVSPFWGSFYGYSNPTIGEGGWSTTIDSGGIEWTISPDGNIVGQFTSNKNGYTAELTGQVDVNGKFTATIVNGGLLVAKLAGQMSYGLGSPQSDGSTPGIEEGDGTMILGTTNYPFSFGAMFGTNHTTSEGTTVVHKTVPASSAAATPTRATRHR